MSAIRSSTNPSSWLLEADQSLSSLLRHHVSSLTASLSGHLAWLQQQRRIGRKPPVLIAEKASTRKRGRSQKSLPVDGSVPALVDDIQELRGKNSNCEGTPPARKKRGRPRKSTLVANVPMNDESERRVGNSCVPLGTPLKRENASSRLLMTPLNVVRPAPVVCIREVDENLFLLDYRDTIWVCCSR